MEREEEERRTEGRREKRGEKRAEKERKPYPPEYILPGMSIKGEGILMDMKWRRE